MNCFIETRSSLKESCNNFFGRVLSEKKTYYIAITATFLGLAIILISICIFVSINSVLKEEVLCWQWLYNLGSLLLIYSKNNVLFIQLVAASLLVLGCIIMFTGLVLFSSKKLSKLMNKNVSANIFLNI